MTKELHLTDTLQMALSEIGSSLKLQNSYNSNININTKDWAYAQVGDRSLQASKYVGFDDKHLQLEEKGIIACTSSTKSLSEIAVIADKWLLRYIDIWNLAKEHDSIKVSEKYHNLLTMTNLELLSNRWDELTREIKKDRISFRLDLFNSLKDHFSHLYPYFSHNNLWFSSVIEQVDDSFQSPAIFCNEATIEVSFKLDNSPNTNSLKTEDIATVINRIKELLPNVTIIATNPLKK